MSVFVVCSTPNLVGSPERMWELIWEAAVLHPVEGNSEGSNLAMKAKVGSQHSLSQYGPANKEKMVAISDLFLSELVLQPQSTPNFSKKPLRRIRTALLLVTFWVGSLASPYQLCSN